MRCWTDIVKCCKGLKRRLVRRWLTFSAGIERIKVRKIEIFIERVRVWYDAKVKLSLQLLQMKNVIVHNFYLFTIN